MTREEAEALAAKREAHKGRSLQHKSWQAVHNSVKGWHVALVDNLVGQAELHRREARAAYLRGDVEGLLSAASASILASCRANLGGTAHE